MMSWSFAQVWNKSLESREQREIKPRERIWASELGGAMIDRYLKMKGTLPTNPPNSRSLRKFEAGNIWEAIIGYVLKRAGIYLDAQEWLQYQYSKLLPVVGKLDYIAGGNPDYDKALNIIAKEFDWMPQSFVNATRNIILSLKEEHPNQLRKIILEIKSCSSFMFEVYERNDTPSPNHKLQLFHYLKSKHFGEGHIVYVSKDDARLLEFGVFNPSLVEEDYKKDIEILSGYYYNEETPPKEKPLVFDEQFKKFSANYKVGYSQYLTMLYGFKNQKEFDDKYKPIAEKFNRVLTRIKDGKDMTTNNKENLAEMRRMGFDVDKIIETIKETKGVENED